MSNMRHTEDLIKHPDGKTRCGWTGHHDDYIAYHDNEWGRPCHEDQQLFEKMCLEGFQSGLSWLTILRKRENFRSAFHQFNPAIIALYTDMDIERLVNDAGIVRHRGKINAVIDNAQRYLELEEQEGSFSDYLWQYQPKPSEHPQHGDDTRIIIPTQTESSVALSKDLKQRGFKFVGPTTLYALMQAMGMVNDHLEGCEFR